MQEKINCWRIYNEQNKIAKYIKKTMMMMNKLK